MAVNAESPSFEKREIIPVGNYIARCYKVIEIGTIHDTYLGKPKISKKCRITWELPTELKVFKEGEPPLPLVIDKKYTLSTADGSHLRADLRNWRGKDFTEEEAKKFDVTVLVGIPCMLNVIHKPKTDGSGNYAFVGSVTPLPKGVDCPPQINKSFVFEHENFDQEKFNSMPEWLRKEIAESDEYKHRFNIASPPNETNTEPEPEPIGNDGVDDLPF